MKRVASVVMALSLTAFLCASAMMFMQYNMDRRSEGSFDSLRRQVQDAVLSSSAEELPDATPSAPSGNEAAGALPKTDDPVILAYRALAQTHPDLVGWLRIDDTVIDYPVMRSPQEAERYLFLDFDGKYSRAGTPFMLPISDPSVPNENIIIYAHQTSSFTHTI